MPFLLVPYILLLLLLIAAVAFVCRRCWVGGVVVVVALAVNVAFHCFAMRLIPRGEGSLKVMALNIHVADDPEKAAAIVDLVERENPDIFCAVELWHGLSEGFDSLMLARSGYERDWTYEGVGYYSRLPFGDRTSVNGLGAEVSPVRIVSGADTLDFCLCHLTSNNYVVETASVAPIDSVRTIPALAAYMRNISSASVRRATQVEPLCAALDPSRPTIVLGDMNDVWGSPALRAFSDAGLHDSWWDAGFGYGPTFHYPLRFRIDHILYSDHLRVRTARRVRTHGLSDHDGIVATFEIGR